MRLRSDLGDFFRALRQARGGKAFPYAWVPEWHSDGERLHAHFAVGTYIKQRLIRDVWGHGHVGIQLLGDLPVGSGRLEEARRAAGYLSKYVAKSFTEGGIPGLHRYDVAQGFQPERIEIWGDSADEVIGHASETFGGVAPLRQWSSADQKVWPRPPAVWVQWAG